MSKQKKILMVSCQHWNTALQVGDHMLARQFVRAGWKVCFISDPVTPFHLLKGFELGPRLKNYFSGGCRSAQGNVWGYVPGGLVMPFNASFLKSAWVHDHWYKLTYPNLVRKVARNGFGKVDALYFRSTKYAFLLDEIQHNISMFRIPDHDAGFFDYYDEVARREKRLAQKVDLTIYTSKPLREYIEKLEPKETLYLPNGVDYQFFATPADQPAEYKQLEGQIAVHVGSALPERFDFEMAGILADEFPQVHFVYIGPDDELRKRIKSKPNIHFFGSKSYESIPGYIQHADIGLILLDVDRNPDLVNSTNPLKLYQYLACGLPVVSRDWDALQGVSPPAYLAKDRNDFVACFAKALSSVDFNPYHLQAYAKKFDWQEQFMSLENKVFEITKEKMM